MRRGGAHIRECLKKFWTKEYFCITFKARRLLSISALWLFAPQGFATVIYPIDINCIKPHFWFLSIPTSNRKGFFMSSFCHPKKLNLWAVNTSWSTVICLTCFVRRSTRNTNRSSTLIKTKTKHLVVLQKLSTTFYFVHAFLILVAESSLCKPPLHPAPS